MKRSRKNGLIQLSILAVLGLAVVLTLVLPEMPAASSQRPILEISVFLQENDMTFSSNTRLGMEQGAADCGAELRFITPATEESHESQLDSVLRETDASAYVISPVDPVALAGALVEDKIPVISFETEIGGSALTIAPDNEAVGSQLAQAVIADTQVGDTILLLDTADERTGIAQRLDACACELEAGRRNVVIATLQEARNMSQEITAVVALEDETTLQLAEWQTNHGMRNKLYGVGGTTGIASYLERGMLTATVAWSDYAMGYLTIQQAARVATGLPAELVESPAITTIRGETIYDTDNQKLLFPVV